MSKKRASLIPITFKHPLQFRILLLLVIAFAWSSCEESPEMYDVTVSVDPPEAGTATTGSVNTYEEGKQVSVTATANEGYVFAGWEGDIQGTSNPLSLTVDQNYSLVATYEKKSYELTVNVEGEGTVQETIIAADSYDHGTVIELDAIPADGYEFKNWSGDLNSTEEPKAIQMDGPKTVTATFGVEGGQAAVKLSVDWNKFEEQVEDGVLSEEVTHLGTRLIYEDQDAVFIQSVSKETANQEGVITMNVPSTGSARLLTAAVHDAKGVEEALMFGVIENITIETGKSYEWNIEDFEWTEAYWEPVDSMKSGYEKGEFIVDKDRERFEFFFLSKDPYYPNPDPSIDNYLIRLNGHGGNSGYKDGFRIMRQIAENPNVGTPNQSEHDNFHPYLKGEMFQLDGRYIVYKEGSFTVKWQ